MGERARAFAHVDGNYASYVKIPIRAIVDDRSSLAATLRACARVARRLERASARGNDVARGLSAECDAHISLSKVFALRKGEIGAMEAALRAALRETRATEATFDRARVFVNDSRTRAFVALGFDERVDADACRGKRALVEMIARVNEACASLGLPRYYEDAEPHASLAWTDETDDDTLRALEKVTSEARVSWTIDVRRIVLDVSGMPDKIVWAREALPPPAL